jgi:hypothetical protein
MRTVHWITTGIICLGFFSAGLAYLARADFAVHGVVELGYPAYFVTILGIGKALAPVALLAPGVPRAKEWAYAGITINLAAAALSHVFVGSAAPKVIVPLVLLAVALTSRATRHIYLPGN